LAGCLHYVFDKNMVEKEDFPVWKSRRRMDAEQQYQILKLEEMKEKGLDTISLNYDEINYEEHSLEYDYLDVLSESMPFIRNLHAHGTNMLDNQVLITFENVSTIINKIYKPKS